MASCSCFLSKWNCSAQILAILRPPGIWPVPSREGQHLCISKVFQQPLIFSLFYLSLWHSHCIPFVLSLGVMMRMRWVTTADYGFLYGENYFFKKWFFLEPYKLNVVAAEEHMLLRNEMPLWIIIICFPPSALKKEDTNADIGENMMEDSNIIGIWLYSHCTVAWRDQECEVKLLRKKISYFLVGIFAWVSYQHWGLKNCFHNFKCRMIIQLLKNNQMHYLTGCFSW